MRYVIVDLDGASRDYFSDRQALVDELRELEAEQPGSAIEFYVVSYDDDGLRVDEPERADEVLAEFSDSRTVAFDRAPRLSWAGAAARVSRPSGAAARAGRSRAAVSA